MQAKQVAFGSLMFLTPTPKELVKKRRVKDVLLMFLRVFSLALLALAFARPYFTTETVSFLAAPERSSTVLLVDESYSMRAGGAWEEAVRRVQDLVASAHEEDEIAILAFSDHQRVVADFESDRDVRSAFMSALPGPGYRTTDFFEPLNAANDLLADARHKDQRVVLISDLQATGWSGTLDNWNLSPGVTFSPVSVSDTTVSNSFIEDVAVSRRRLSEDVVAMRFDARVKSQGSTQALNVILEIDGREAGRTRVGSSGSEIATFQHTVESAGVYQGRLYIENDALQVDNSYYFTLKVDRKPSVLVVDDTRRSRYPASFFLTTAFAPASDGAYNVRSVGRGQLSAANLRDQSIAFITNVNSLSTSDVQTLKQWIERGGHVVLAMGASTTVSGISQTLQRLEAGSADSIVDARSMSGGSAIIGDVQWTHPVFSTLADAGNVILRPQFRKYLRVQQDSTATAIASFDSGDPFLIEKKIGSGSLLIFTSSLSSEWTDFPIDEMYVPFLYQLADYAVRSATRQSMFVVGDVVSFEGGSGRQWEVQTPDGEIFQLRSDSDDASRVFFLETEVPGHYLATSGTNRVPFSVNLNTIESDIRPRDIDEAYAAVISPFVDNIAGDESVQTAGQDPEDQPLWKFLLAGVIIMLIVETILAHRNPVTTNSHVT